MNRLGIQSLGISPTKARSISPSGGQHRKGEIDSSFSSDIVGQLKNMANRADIYRRMSVPSPTFRQP
jgi:hypothetical protein